MEEQQLRQKEHHDEGRAKLQECKLNEVVLVRNWLRSVERWIPGRITQVKGPRTYLVCCDDQIRFVHMDHLKSARWIQSSSYWEGEEDGNYARNFPSSQAELKSGAWSPSELLVNTSEAGGVPDAGDMEEHETTEVTPESSLGDALEGASPSGTPLSLSPLLHLNAKGSSLLAVQFIKFLRSGSGKYNQSLKGFQSSAIQQLVKLLMELGNLPSPARNRRRPR